MSSVNDTAASASALAESASIPADALIIVPVRNTVLFPGVVIPISIGRLKSIAAAQQAVREQRQIGLVLQRDAEASEPWSVSLPGAYCVGSKASLAGATAKWLHPARSGTRSRGARRMTGSVQPPDAHARELMDRGSIRRLSRCRTSSSC